jgi:hypothetical protein
MYVVDEFITAAPDASLAVVAVAVVLGWPSARGSTVGNISAQIGCSPATIIRSMTKFCELAGLDSNGAVQCVRPGAGSNGDGSSVVRTGAS